MSSDDIDWDGFVDLCSQPSFFGPKLYVLKKAEVLLADNPRKQLRIAPGNACVLSSDHKSNPFGKAVFSGDEEDTRLVEANHPGFYDAVRWVRDELQSKGFKVQKDAAETLVTVAGRNMESLANEVQKIMLLCASEDAQGDSGKQGKTTSRKPRLEITKSLVLSCASPDQETNTFALIDAVASKDVAKASQELENLLARGVNHTLIVSALASHFGLMWRAKEEMGKNTSPDSLAGALGVHPYSARKALNQCKIWTFADLESALRLLCDVDEAIKKGTQDPQTAVRYLIFGLAKN